jgi:hypothetical protein
VIALEAGATFSGPFTLPARAGDGWVTIRSSAEGRLPPPGTRVDPAQADAMPKLVATSAPVVSTARGAHHYRFVGIEIRPRPGAFLTNLVQLGSGETSVEHLPHHIVFDRCYLHGDPRRGTRRGIAMNSRHTAVVDSYLSDFKEVGADSQAVAAWNGPGPFRIANSYLEGAGENVLFGGADPAIRDLVPSDIEIRGNHFAKPLAWKVGHPSFGGTAWTVKNLFELKNARRVLVQGNLFERNWAHAQSGFAILFTVRNQDGAAPWSVVEDVTFVDNVVRHAAAGINVLGHDDLHASRQTARVLIRNNLFDDLGGTGWGGPGTLFQLLGGTARVVIEQNTALQRGSVVVADGPPHAGFVLRGNIALHNDYGIIGTGTSPGAPTLERYFPGAVVTGNVLVGGPAARYPGDNLFPATLAEVGFAEPRAGDYRLAPASRARRGREGRAPGADLDALPAPLLRLLAARPAESR